MRWTGHVLRRGSESLIKNVWEGEIAGTRRRGRPKLRWKDQIKKDMEQINITEEEAQDRTLWRSKVGEAKSLLGFKWPWQNQTKYPDYPAGAENPSRDQGSLSSLDLYQPSYVTAPAMGET
ncbi:hypothetical protein WDU94_002536 [Cyamophila willieti]